MISNTGNFTQDTLTNSVNLAIVMNTKNPIMSSFMQGAATSFISSLFADDSEALRQQQAMSEEIARRAREQAEQRRIAEQQRIDAVFARLTRELKLEGLPFSLSLKGMNSADPAALQLKGMSSSGPEGLSLKLSQSSPTSYGLKGLPGIYVGGPAGSDDSAAAAKTQISSMDRAPAEPAQESPDCPASISMAPSLNKRLHSPRLRIISPARTRHWHRMPHSKLPSAIPL